MKLAPRLVSLRNRQIGVPFMKQTSKRKSKNDMPNGTAQDTKINSREGDQTTALHSGDEKKGSSKRGLFSRFKKKKDRGKDSPGGPKVKAASGRSSKNSSSSSTMRTGGSVSATGGSGKKSAAKDDNGHGPYASAEASDQTSEASKEPNMNDNINTLMRLEEDRPESFVTAENESGNHPEKFYDATDEAAYDPAAVSNSETGDDKHPSRSDLDAVGGPTTTATSQEGNQDNKPGSTSPKADDVVVQDDGNQKQGRSKTGTGNAVLLSGVITTPAEGTGGQETEIKRNISFPDVKDVTEAAQKAENGSENPEPPRQKAKFERRKTTPPAFLSAAVGGISVFDGPETAASYEKIPLCETTKLPRGGITIETEAVGRVQFGIPPETIKDSMRLGLGVPCVYIVPVERFCREMGPALGVNLAEFEFPAYFNFFVQRRRCTLIVDSLDAEKNIRKVFSETLLGPGQFRRKEGPIAYQNEDFDPTFNREAIPNFAKELQHFRIMPNGSELELETLLQFAYFETPTEDECQTQLGVPPPLEKQDRRQKMNKASSQGRVVVPDVDAPENKPTRNKSQSQDEMRFFEREEGDKHSGVRKNWTYSQVKWVGDVATVYANDASPEQIASRTCKRCEIFKMPGGTEYILHDINENNHIVGKARFSGHVRVPEYLSVAGFAENCPLQSDSLPVENDSSDQKSSITSIVPNKNVLPPTFHPPSFGVTVLGNSHGFDKSGSTSGYVLWINGRGVMIDPPPYSSATLEREGIRPRTIVGIILTHCHADHDAGAFQKVLTGSPVVVITTPTIYESFIRKYAALSALSPALLRHSHRHKSAIIGKPLRFQGATFHFTYTLHSIPCVGFRVEWRGRSMVFTGDHMNIPEQIDTLQEKGVLSRARADDLRNLPLQDTDLLLHESGAPPIHTPLDVLLKLPARVKRRLYVVHTSALPEGCELRVAPTGTAGTIRLDQLALPDTTESSHEGQLANSVYSPRVRAARRYSCISEDAQILDFPEDMMNEYGSQRFSPSFGGRSTDAKNDKRKRATSVVQGGKEPPLVALRPTSSTDAWFILNLLSAVPFLSSLSYSSTMEVLETARVDAYCVDEVVVPASRRRDVLCVVWEGTCMEREQSSSKMNLIPKEKVATQKRHKLRVSNVGALKGKNPAKSEQELKGKKRMGAVWYAGDWTGPRSLQPEKRMSGESSLSKTHDIVAMSSEGVKVITIEFSNLHAILQSGSPLYRKYINRKKQQAAADSNVGNEDDTAATQIQREAIRNLNLIELLDCNSSLRKLSAVQKRHLESLAEGPVYYGPGQRLWRAGAPVDKAFIVVVGTVAFVPKRRNAGSVGIHNRDKQKAGRKHPITASITLRQDDDAMNFGEEMRLDALRAMKELEALAQEEEDDDSSISSSPSDSLPTSFEGKRLKDDFNASARDNMPRNNEFVRLELGLKNRADSLGKAPIQIRRSSSSSEASFQPDHHDVDSTYSDSAKSDGQKHVTLSEDITSRRKRYKSLRRTSSKDQLANKVLGRLYSRRAFTAGLVFSRGHFLGDVSKMVAGLLSTDYDGDDSSFKYGFGDKAEGDSGTPKKSVGDLTIHEREGDQLVVHSSTLAAGKDGCSVIFFPKASLINFLDEYPGLLLSLLGTQVVV